jgi:hypothetical protein
VSWHIKTKLIEKACLTFFHRLFLIKPRTLPITLAILFNNSNSNVFTPCLLVYYYNTKHVLFFSIHNDRNTDVPG